MIFTNNKRLDSEVKIKQATDIFHMNKQQ